SFLTSTGGVTGNAPKRRNTKTGGPTRDPGGPPFPPAANPPQLLARRTPGVAGPVWRGRKWIGAAPAAFRPYRRPALIERRIAAVLAAVPRVDRAPASADPRRLAPLRARPALGVSIGEQQSHHCDTEQNKTD